MKKKLYLCLLVLALLFLTPWHGAGQRTNSARQTWEYRVEEAPNYPNGSFVDPDKAQQLLNQRGAEGWELIAVAGGQPLFYFRRAK
jgi:hypothetical protein